MDTIMEFVKDLSTLQALLIFIFVIPYGLAFGVKNMFIRVLALFGGGRFTQNDRGKFLDMVWLSWVIYLAITM